MVDAIEKEDEFSEKLRKDEDGVGAAVIPHLQVTRIEAGHHRLHSGNKFEFKILGFNHQQEQDLLVVNI